MVESGSNVQDWERFKDQLKQVGEQIALVAQYLREGTGSREELASVLDGMSELVGTTLPDSLVISGGAAGSPLGYPAPKVLLTDLLTTARDRDGRGCARSNTSPARLLTLKRQEFLQRPVVSAQSSLAPDSCEPRDCGQVLSRVEDRRSRRRRRS
jgi:hypothetical protein